MTETFISRNLSENKKEVWQMTKAEYETLYGKPNGASTVTGKFSPHRSSVEIAINRGLLVPEEVLRDYPQLREM